MCGGLFFLVWFGFFKSLMAMTISRHAEIVQMLRVRGQWALLLQRSSWLCQRPAVSGSLCDLGKANRTSRARGPHGTHVLAGGQTGLGAAELLPTPSESPPRSTPERTKRFWSHLAKRSPRGKECRFQLALWFPCARPHLWSWETEWQSCRLRAQDSEVVFPLRGFPAVCSPPTSPVPLLPCVNLRGDLNDVTG